MKKTLVIGASTNPERYSYKATEMLLEYNHKVVLFGLKKGTILENDIKTDFPNDQNIDTITLYVGAKNQTELFEKIVNLKPNRIIFNPGTENPLFYGFLKSYPQIKYEEACTLVLLSTNQF